jgi:hypothetical protein
VMDVLLYNVRDVSGGDSSFSFEDQRLVQGNFGSCPYASLARGAMHDGQGTQEIGTRFLLGGMLEKYGYSLEVVATPQPGLESMKELVHFLESGVSYKGPLRDPKWSDADAKARWERDAPEKLEKKLGQIVRTKHYIVLTDSGSKTTCEKFGEQMEKNYDAIRKTYPFDEVPGRKLMPLFLFVSEDSYYEYFAKISSSTLEEARKSMGVAYGDWYATYFEAKNDPVHIHEGTHQIFANRLRLGGGGSWFQEGVAEYICTTKNDRNDAARTVKKGREVPLVDFVKVKSLLFSPKDAAKEKKGEEDSASQYALAACLIEFLRESKFGKDKFQDFIHAMGLVPRSNLPGIQRVVQQVYGMDLAGLEKEWVEYCKKR